MYCSMIRFSLMLLLSLQSSTTICSFRPSAAALLVRPRSSPFLVSINSSTAPAVRHQHSGSTTIPPLRSQSKAHDSKTTGDTISSSSSNTQQQPRRMAVVPLLRSEGLFAVNKPLEWTSQDAVAYIRGILERDARNRGARPAKVTSSRRNKGRVVRVGHGGTLDPLATGVLVIGVGKGTKELQRCVRTHSDANIFFVGYISVPRSIFVHIHSTAATFRAPSATGPEQNLVLKQRLLTWKAMSQRRRRSTT